MKLTDILVTFVINVVSASFVFTMGFFWHLIPKSWRERQLRRFWGRDLFTGNLVVCHGTFHLDTKTQGTLVKRYRDGATVNVSGPADNLIGDAEIRAVAYLVRELSIGHTPPTVTIESDSKAFSRLTRTVIALGSGSSNELTRLILDQRDNAFWEFVRDPNGTVFIQSKSTGRRYPKSGHSPLKDYGIITKLHNDRSEGSFFFVCAGLGDWGTSGAAWYLTSHWKDLMSEFHGPFGVVVEVDVGSDESARRV